MPRPDHEHEESWALPYNIDAQQIYRLTGLIGGNVAAGVIVRGSGAMRSEDFVTGSSGWNIDGDGNVEFNSGTFRGTLDGADGTFTGTLSAGTITGGTITGAEIFIPTAGAPAFSVDTDGAVTASDITITGGSIAGASIDIGGSDSTSFHVDTDGNMWLGSGDYATAVFKVSNAGAVVALSMTITGGYISIGDTVIDTDGDVNIGPTAGLYIDSTTGDLWFGAAAIGDAMFVIDAGTGAVTIQDEDQSSKVKVDPASFTDVGRTFYRPRVKFTVPATNVDGYIGQELGQLTVQSGYDSTGVTAGDTPSKIDLLSSSSQPTAAFSGQIHGINGSASAPSYAFNNDTDCGMYRDSTNQIAWAVNGTKYMQLNYNAGTPLFEFQNSCVLRAVDGSVSAPGISFNNATDAGLFRNAASQISIATGGANMMRFQNDGTRAIYSETIRLDAPGSLTANIRINPTSGQIQRSTSSRRYKDHIEYGVDRIADRFFDMVQPARFRNIGNGEHHIGLIAEDVAAVDRRLADIDEDGQADNVAWHAVTALLVAEVRRLRELVDAR